MVTQQNISSLKIKLVSVKRVKKLIQYQMMDLTQTKSKNLRTTILKIANIFMLILCAIASISLYFTPSFFHKLFLSILLVSYSTFLLVNGPLIKIIFDLKTKQNPSKYNIVYQWQIPESKKQSFFSGQQTNKLTNQSSFINQSIQSLSFDRNISSSQSKAKTSQLNESYYSEYKKISTRQTKGLNLLELPFMQQKSLQKSMVKSRIKEKGVTLVDKKTNVREALDKIKYQSNQKYLAHLQLEIKKDHKYIESKYKIILNTLNQLVTHLLNQNNSNTRQLSEIGSNYLQASLVQEKKACSIMDLLRPSKEQSLSKLNIQFYIFQLMLMHTGKVAPQKLGFQLKSDKTWNQFKNKITPLITERLKIGQSLGISSSLVESRFSQSTTQFLDLYNQRIAMLTQYKSSNSTDNKIQIDYSELTDNQYSKIFVSKLYVLHLFVRDINRNLREEKIAFEDYYNFGKIQANNAGFEIVAESIFDKLIPHFHFYRCQTGGKKKFECQFGQNNYLSIIYQLIWCLGQKNELLRWNSHIYRLVHEIL